MKISDMVANVWSNNASEYYENICKCIVAYLLNHTHQSKFNWLINAPCTSDIYSDLGTGCPFH